MLKKAILFGLMTALFMGLLFSSPMKAATAHKDFSAYNLNPQIYKLAIKAHSEAVRLQQLDNPDILTIVDYSQPSNQKRMWVIRLSTMTVLHYTYVAHGVSSGQLIPTHFSNVIGSRKSSIGVFKTGSIYLGKHGRSLNLHGLEKQFNSNAYRRRVVLHGSSYVGEDRAKHGALGRSHGCLALSFKDINPVINDIKNGTLIFAYYPDSHWLDKSIYT